MATADLRVGPEHEALHAPSADPLWSESFYLNFSDRRGVLGGFTRIALHPTRNESAGLLCVYLRGGGVGLAVTSDRLAQSDDRAVRAGALVHTRVASLNHWRISYDGELQIFADPSRVPDQLRPDTPSPPRCRIQLALDATGLHAPFFYPDYRKVAAGPPYQSRGPLGLARTLKRIIRRPGEIVSALNMRKGRHYEQSMRVGGVMVVDGERLELDGTGHRDHSWGPRDWAPSERWRWLTGQMDGLAFNAMYLTIAGTHVTNGYVWSGDRCAPVDDLRLESTFDDTGLAGRTVSLHLSAGGATYAIAGDVLINVPLPISGDRFTTMYNVGRTRYRCGDRVGYGVAEFLERLDP